LKTFQDQYCSDLYPVVSSTNFDIFLFAKYRDIFVPPLASKHQTKHNICATGREKAYPPRGRPSPRTEVRSLHTGGEVMGGRTAGSWTPAACRFTSPTSIAKDGCSGCTSVVVLHNAAVWLSLSCVQAGDIWFAVRDVSSTSLVTSSYGHVGGGRMLDLDHYTYID